MHKNQTGAASLTLVILLLIILPIIVLGIMFANEMRSQASTNTDYDEACKKGLCTKLPDGRTVYPNGDVLLVNGLIIQCGFCTTGPTGVLFPKDKILEAIDKAANNPNPSGSPASDLSVFTGPQPSLIDYEQLTIEGSSSESQRSLVERLLLLVRSMRLPVKGN